MTLEPAATSSRSGTRQYVADALRSALVTGELLPGERYSAPQLAKRLGVSATPVREAMLDFVRMGLVDVEANAGFRIVAPTTADLDELLEVRILLEEPTMGKVATACRNDELVARRVTDLRPLAEDTERAASDGDLVKYVASDIAFHHAFLMIHGNARLAQIASELRNSSRLFGLSTLAAAGRLVETTHEHALMIDAALAGDVNGLKKLVRTHLGHSRGTWASGAAD